MMQRHLAAALVATLGAAVPLAGQNQQGDFLRPQPDQSTTRVANRGANFLEIGVGARGQALAGAVTGMAEGVTAMYWNPAGIATAEGLDAAFSYTDLYGDLGINHAFMGVLLPFASGGVGVSYTRLTSGDIPRTDEGFPGGDNLSAGPTFEWVAQAVGLHYGRRLTDRLQVGIGFKVVDEGFTGAKANWWGLDVGTMFNTGLYGLTVGAALTNIGSSARFEGSAVQVRVEADDFFTGIDVPVRFNTTSYSLPTAFRFALVENIAGGADALLMPGGDHSFKVALDLLDGVDTDLQSAIGAEYGFRGIAFLRAGKRFVNEGPDVQNVRGIGHALSVGGGLRVFGQRLVLDYAYTEMNELDNVQVFSLELNF